MNINVAVTDANNIVCEVTPTPTQLVTIDRGVVGNGIVSISVVLIDGDEYLHIVFTNGTTSDVGPISATYYTGTSPIVVNNTTNVISLDVVPVTLGGTNATTASGARTSLAAAYTGTTISASTGLSGGGDLSANRTLAIANTGVTAASYGSASKALTATVNAQGQLTALADTNIAIANTQVSGLGTASTQNAGVANGVATLDAGGTVPLSQIPASIQGGVSYQGTWNASTNTPTLTSSVGTKGYYYVVSVAGSTNLNGITDWQIGDWAIYNGTAWQKIDNTDAVTSVNGYTGTVVLTNTDVGAPPTSLTITAGTGLSGGGSLAANRTLSIANTTVTANPYGSASAVPTFTVNAQGQLTAASNTTIAIANTQVSGLGTMSTQNANSVAITGGNITGITDLAIADGGTGASTANAAFNALAPSQTGNTGKYLTTNGTDTSWATNPLGTVTSVDVSGGTTGLTTSGGPITTSGTITLAGTLAIGNGGTGQTTANASLNALLPTQTGNASKYLQTDGTNATWDAISLSTADITGILPTANGGTGLGGATPFTSSGVVYASSASALTTGSSLVFNGTNLAVGTNSILSTDKLTVSISSTSTSSPFGSAITNIKLINTSNTVGNGTFITNAYSNAAQNAYIGFVNVDQNYASAIVFGTAISGASNYGERVRIDSAGNVGIGNPSPTYKLDVTGNGNFTSLLTLAKGSSQGLTIGDVATNSNSVLRMQGTSAGYNWQIANNLNVGGLEFTPSTATGGTTYTNPVYSVTGLGLHKWFNGTTQAMTLDASGNLGINNTSPSTFGKVTIQVTGTTTPTTASNVGPASINLYNAGSGGSTDATMGIFGWQAGNPGIGSGIGFTRESSTNWGTQLRFYTHINDVANIGDITERARIDSVGNFGIGTTSPTAKLDIVGPIMRNTGYGTPAQLSLRNANGSVGAETATTIDQSIGGTYFAGYGASAFGLNVGAIVCKASQTFTATAQGTYLTFETTADGAASRTERMRLDNAGNLIVGALSAGNAKVTSVNGIAFEARDGTQPFYQWFNSGAATDKKYWRVGVNTSGDLQWQTVNDAYNSASNRMILNASGNLVIGSTIANAKLNVNTTSYSAVTNGEQVLIENTSAWSQGLAFSIWGSGTYGSGYASGYIGAPNTLNQLYISGGAVVVNNTASPSWAKTLNSTSASFLIVGAGATTFYGDTGLAVNTAYTPTARMLLDSAGNLGLGVTPSAWSGVGSVLQVGLSAAIMGNSTGSASVLMNAYYNGSAYTYINTATASRLAMTGGAFSFLQAPSGTAGNPISFTNSMTLDASGRLVIGATSTTNKFLVYDGVSSVSGQSGGGATVPSAYHVSSSLFRIGLNGSVSTSDASALAAVGTYFSDNSFFKGSTGNAGRIVTGASSQVALTGGTIALRYAGSAASDTDISWSTALYVNNSGSVGIGTSSPSAKLDVNGDAYIYGVTVGRGGGAGASNTVLGNGAFTANSTGTTNVSIGYVASRDSTGSENVTIGAYRSYARTTGDRNVFVGMGTGVAIVGTGSNNTGIGAVSLTNLTSGYANSTLGSGAGSNLQTGSCNVFIGDGAGYYSTGNSNTFVGGGNTNGGYSSGSNVTSGGNNTFLGTASGRSVTTGSYNTIIGAFAGSAADTNRVVLSDGQGNAIIDSGVGKTVALQGATSASGTGITFPATQSASSNTNTLDDYEEGSWTPYISGDSGASGQTYSTQLGTYIKVGNLVTAMFNAVLTNKGTLAGGVIGVTGLPFAASNLGVITTAVDFSNLTSSFASVTLLTSNSTFCYIRQITTTAGSSDYMGIAAVGNTTSFRASFSYITAS